MAYPLLDQIRQPGVVKRLPLQDLPALCGDIRQFLIESVSATGGHLSSNLGVGRVDGGAAPRTGPAAG